MLYKIKSYQDEYKWPVTDRAYYTSKHLLLAHNVFQIKYDTPLALENSQGEGGI